MEPASHSRRRRASVLVAGAAWLLAVTAGFAVLWKYKSTPGERASVPSDWPAGATVARAAGKSTLLMFAHPGCTCTRASIAELAWIMARFHDALDARVLFWKPRDAPPDWDAADLRTSAARIPGVSVAEDVDGREAERFGVTTSGAVVLYGRGGRLLFKGGITPARGHEGDSFGRERIALLLSGGVADRAEAPVFGCALGGERPAGSLAQATQPSRNEGRER
jgi:hypothetical protein